MSFKDGDSDGFAHCGDPRPDFKGDWIARSEARARCYLDPGHKSQHKDIHGNVWGKEASLAHWAMVEVKGWSRAERKAIEAELSKKGG